MCVPEIHINDNSFNVCLTFPKLLQLSSPKAILKTLSKQDQLTDQS